MFAAISELGPVKTCEAALGVWVFQSCPTKTVIPKCPVDPYVVQNKVFQDLMITKWPFSCFYLSKISPFHCRGHYTSTLETLRWQPLWLTAHFKKLLCLTQSWQQPMSDHVDKGPAFSSFLSLRATYTPASNWISNPVIYCLLQYLNLIRVHVVLYILLLIGCFFT